MAGTSRFGGRRNRQVGGFSASCHRLRRRVDQDVVAHRLGDDGDVEVLGECENRGNDRGVFAFCADRTDEGLVDLDDIDGKRA
jgi:hypothetical protein